MSFARSCRVQSQLRAAEQTFAASSRRQFHASRSCPFSQTSSKVVRPALSSRARPANVRQLTSNSADQNTMSGDRVIDFDLPKDIPESEQTAANAPAGSLFSLRDQTIMITGAGRGLGISLASAVLEAGAHVACTDVLSEPAPKEWTELQDLAKRRGLTATYKVVDITDEKDMESTVEEISSQGRSRGAPLRGAIGCAGIQQKLNFLEYPLEDFERMFKVNTTGAFLTSKVVANDMVKNKVPGSIVLIASMSGNIANRGLFCSAYNSSKAAVHQLCRSMAQEVGVHGIRVNTLSPGYIRTKMTDELLAVDPELEKLWMAGAMLNRLGAPEDFKAPSVFLLSRGSSFMTGSDLRVDGGHTASA